MITVAMLAGWGIANELHADGPSPEARILILPRNYDAADPWAYTRQRGIPDPGCDNTGLVWNQPIFVRAALGPAPEMRVGAVLVRHLGKSVQGSPILMYVFGNPQSKVNTLIFGAIHGNEPNSGQLATRLLEYLLDHPEIVRDQRVGIIPIANPDGFATRQRTNKHGIDLNRNFPATNWKVTEPGNYFGGTIPASEPETQALLKGVEWLRPDRIVTIHAITRGKHGNNYDGPGAALAERMREANGYPVLKTIGYPTPGSFGSWAGIDRQVATITLELPEDLPGDKAWEEQRTALLDVILSPALLGK